MEGPGAFTLSILSSTYSEGRVGAIVRKSTTSITQVSREVEGQGVG